METLQEKITQLKNELAELEAQERTEKEEARKKKQAERESDLKAISEQINAFNAKYNETIALGIRHKSDEIALSELLNWLAR